MLRQKAGWMTRAGYKAALVISLALSLFLAGSGGEIVPQRPDRVDFGDLVPFPDFDRDPRYSPMMAQYEAILRGDGTTSPSSSAMPTFQPSPRRKKAAAPTGRPPSNAQDFEITCRSR